MFTFRAAGEVAAGRLNPAIRLELRLRVGEAGLGSSDVSSDGFPHSKVTVNKYLPSLFNEGSLREAKPET